MGYILSELGLKHTQFNSGEINSIDYIKMNNIITKWLSDSLHEIMINCNPKFIGISISLSSQLVYGLYLAKYIKDNYKDVKIIVGGSFLSEHFDSSNSNNDIFQLFDYIVIGEGYDAILDIVKGKLQDKKVIKIDKKLNKSPKAIPLPDFSDMDLEKYITPVLTLPIYPSRGCYWGKCAFCNIKKIENAFTQKTATEILHDMIELNSRYGCHNFYFSSDAMSINTLLDISIKIKEGNYDFSWECEVRFENQLNEETLRVLSKGGCSLLRFGLESGSQVVLDNMQKGIKLEQAQNILRLANKYGIKTAVYCIIDFPGENLNDIYLTKKFLENNKDYIDYAGVHRYQLLPGSPMHEEPTSYRDITYDSEGVLYYKSKFTDDQLMKIMYNIKHDLKDDINFQGIPVGFYATAKKIDFEKYELDDFMADKKWLVSMNATKDIDELKIKTGQELIMHLPTGTIISEN